MVTDITGQVLGSFPSGQGITGSALPEHVAGWYPPATVQAAAEAAGMVWADRDFTGSADELAATFPGAVPHLSLWRRMASVQSYFLLTQGGIVVMVAAGVVAAQGWAGLLPGLVIGLFGGGLVAVGIMLSQPGLRWLHRRHREGAGDLGRLDDGRGSAL